MDSNIRNEIATTFHSTGFQFILQIAEKLVKAQMEVAIEEEDSVKGEVERRKAQAQRKFLDNLTTLVKQAVAGEYSPVDEQQFNEVTY